MGFVAATAITSTGLTPAGVLSAAKGVQEVLLVAALVGLGTGIHLRTLRRTGGRALVLALASRLLVGTTADAGVILLGACSTLST